MYSTISEAIFFAIITLVTLYGVVWPVSMLTLWVINPKGFREWHYKHFGDD